MKLQLNRAIFSISIAALSLITVASAVNRPNSLHLKRGLDAVARSSFSDGTDRASNRGKMRGQKANANEILRLMIERYSHLTTYQSTGTAAEGTEIAGNKETIYETTFELSFTRPNFVSLRWPEAVSPSDVIKLTEEERTKFVLLGNNDGSTLFMNATSENKEGRFKPLSFPDIITGLRVAYVSSHSVAPNLVAELLIGDAATEQRLLQLKNMKLREEVYEGEKCYLITGISRKYNLGTYVDRLWINKNDLLLRKYEIRLKTQKKDIVTEEIHRSLSVNQAIPQEIYQPRNP